MNMLLPAFLLLILFAFMKLTFCIEKGYLKYLILFLLLVMTFTLFYFSYLDWLAWVLILILLDLFILFYGDESVRKIEYFITQAVLFFGLFCLLKFSKTDDLYSWMILFYLVFQYMFILYLKELRLRYLYVWLMIFFGVALWLMWNQNTVLAIILMFISIAFIEYVFQFFLRNFRSDTLSFQQNVMAHHYEEVKSVYLSMRGWRHDYHNHIQTLMAYLQMSQYAKANDYLHMLEQDLKQVDTLVKSGNMLMDAVMNSKLTLAAAKEISISAALELPEVLSISDIDLCVIVGNLMDNAMESCMKVEAQHRFIRVYCAIVKKQFYLSITNAAKGDSGFNEKHYISEKRGDHGHGMKRVKLSVDKYDGYLNLQNEDGVFASEVMIPLI